jgi:ABC-type antimicrobial peptide transport system permease subunit
VLVRTRGAADRFEPTLQAFLREAAPTLPASVTTLAQADEQTYHATLTSASMAMEAGLLALVLASLGLYGVVSLQVRQRTREIGVRIAVGATPAGVSRMFLASGVRVSLIALAIGLPLSIVALKVGMSTGAVIAPSVNPYVIGVVLAPVLVVVAVMATWIPARRAAMVDLAMTLRVE